MTYDGTITMSDPGLVHEFDDMPTGFKAYVVVDPDAQCPDWDGLGYVYRIDHGGARYDDVAIAGDYGDNGADVGPVREAWDRFGDWELVARYLRMFHNAVSVSVLNRRDYNAVAVVTRTHAETWGCDPIAWPTLADNALAVYEQWADGNVYGVIVVDTVAGEEYALWDVYDDAHDYAYCRTVADELMPAGIVYDESEVIA